MYRLLTLTALLSAVPPAAAYDSCCKKKGMEFIPDPDALPPDFDPEGHPRLIPDPEDVKPALWDEEDDGPYSPREIPNPLFTWTPPMIRNPVYRPPSFVEKLQAEVLKAVPWVVLGTLLTVLLDAAQLPLHRLRGRLGRANLATGALLGLATPLCSCGSLPIAAGFASHGVPMGTVIAFLTATQAAGLDSAAITWGLLGPTAALCRLGGALILAICAGAATPRGYASSASASVTSNGEEPNSATPGPWRLVTAALDTTASVFPLVFCGILLSTAAVHSLPSLSEMSATGGAVTRVAVLASALPLQLCEHSAVTRVQLASNPSLASAGIKPVVHSSWL